MTSIFVTGIGTEIGKTVSSAVLCAALKAAYWKPVQSGDLEQSDSLFVQSLLPDTKVFPEQYRLKTPISPHASAAIDGVEIDLNAFSLPEHTGNLVIEGAGGLLVPLNRHDTILDLIGQLSVPVVLVSQNYLGSINHTLLSVSALRSAGIPLLGILFNGESNSESESIILEMSKLPCLGRIGKAEQVDAAFIQSQVQNIAVPKIQEQLA